MADETKPTRKGSPPIKVYCLPDERRAIEEKAAAAGMSLSAYLLAVGQGYKITGVVDYEHVRLKYLMALNKHESIQIEESNLAVKK